MSIQHEKEQEKDEKKKNFQRNVAH